jgi:hypothetical protein
MKKLFIIILFLGLVISLACIYQIKNNKRINSEIILSEGEYIFKDDFYVPEKKTLIIKPGANLKIGRGASIIVEGKIIARGTKEKPITFSSYDDYWRGIKIIGKQRKLDLDNYKKALKGKEIENTDFLKSFENSNIFLYCTFKNLATNQVRDVANRKKAVLEVKNSSLVVSHSKFEDIVHMGVIQTENSFLLINHSEFLSEMVMKVIHPINSVAVIHDNLIEPKRYEYQTWPDGVFVNAGIGIVVNNSFDGLSDDAIDFDGSLAYIFGNSIKKTFDDGIDIDNKTEAYIIDNKIEDISEGGVLVSNQSKAFLFNNNITKTEHGIVLRNGGKVFADNLTIDKSKIGILIYQGIPLILTEEDFQNVKKEVSSISKEEMNGIGIYEVNSPQDLGDLLEKTYTTYKGYRIINNSVEQSDTYFGLFLFLKKTLKLVNSLELGGNNYDTFKKLGLDNDFLNKYNNSLYIKNSEIKNVLDDLILKKPYHIKMENVGLKTKKYNMEEGEDIKNFITEEEVNNVGNQKRYIEELIKKINLITI